MGRRSSDLGPFFLYRWHTASGRLIYLGITDDAGRRKLEHERTKGWARWCLPPEVTALPRHWTWGQCRTHERQCIALERPACNEADNPWADWELIALSKTQLPTPQHRVATPPRRPAAAQRHRSRPRRAQRRSRARRRALSRFLWELVRYLIGMSIGFGLMAAILLHVAR
jgi:hypothetical protein